MLSCDQAFQPPKQNNFEIRPISKKEILYENGITFLNKTNKTTQIKGP